MFGQRIKMARKYAGLSQKDLADFAGVTAQALSQYEKNKISPSSTTLIKLADATGVAIDYFFQSNVIVKREEVKPSFRKKSGLPKKIQEQIIYQIIEWLERYIEVEAYFPDKNIKYTFPYKEWRVNNIADVENIAIELRKKWNLGLGPLPSIIELLEDKEVEIGLIKTDVRFDACSFVFKNRPIIVLNEKFPLARQSFTLLHELAHLILDIADNLDEESIANRFAGAFLVPKLTVIAELGENCNYITLRDLYYLKLKYKLSMQAWIYRLTDLELIFEEKGKQLWRKMSQNNWRKNEPGDNVPGEKSKKMERLIYKALDEEIITFSKAAAQLKVDIITIRTGYNEWRSLASGCQCYN